MLIFDMLTFVIKISNLILSFSQHLFTWITLNLGSATLMQKVLI